MLIEPPPEIGDVDFDNWVQKLTTIYNALGIFDGAGSPEGVKTADIGSLYKRNDGGANTTLYVKESGTGSTGWIAK